MSNLQNIGAQLANCAYNLAQDEKIPKPWRETLDRLRKEWDAAIAAPVASAAPSGELPPLPEAGYFMTGHSTDAGIDVQTSLEAAQSICDLNNQAERDLQARDTKFYDPDWKPSQPEPLFDSGDMQAHARAAIAHQPPKEALTLQKLNELAAKHIKDIAGYERPIKPMGEDHEFIILCRAIEAASAPNAALVEALKQIANLRHFEHEESWSIATEALASVGVKS